ncbi:uncharacterized protein PHALS_01797 [Plasmopara halstedii]|uniref:Uncharacterized protein n=1 Tax=Plasmopara halstedii TaxID=4781 RepID=A0A0P1AVN6_PLAHL|nr:uncharacterized protein PHALS_01797 [Plasmopara halstedii]CEG45506.1 hypothetical protein PHALS_01797 [Plasmopara halstedii]|eukprot:XP_024581875.1 hypothetical protein PHALS_01797 [Plasmopara halstedii]
MECVDLTTAAAISVSGTSTKELPVIQKRQTITTLDSWAVYCFTLRYQLGPSRSTDDVS